MMRIAAVASLALCSFSLFASDPPLKSGPQVGQRPGPYAFVMATGPQRGQAFCYICETADQPAAILFVRSLNEPIGKLAAKLDQSAADGTVPNLKTWLTLLDDGKQTDAERRLIEWGRHHAIKTMPLGIFEDEHGPPSYKLHAGAEATVLLFVNQKVVANFAIRPGDLNEAKIGEIVKALGQLKVKKD